MTANAVFWNGIAENYAAQPVENPDAFDRKIAAIKARMRPEDVVLELGCGTGSLALRLQAHAAQIHGVDISDAMIRIARGKAEAAGASNVSFHVGSLEEGLDAFEPESVDVALAFSLLHLVEDRAATLRWLYERLEPGGTFVASTVCLGKRAWFFRPLIGTMRFFGKAPRVWMVTPEALVEEIRAAGFVDVETPDVGAKDTIAFTIATKPV
ncbi:MAG: class I SAM-dependent methyltransferase [Myxococcota bacterium]